MQLYEVEVKRDNTLLTAIIHSYNVLILRALNNIQIDKIQRYTVSGEKGAIGDKDFHESFLRHMTVVISEDMAAWWEFDETVTKRILYRKV